MKRKEVSLYLIDEVPNILSAQFDVGGERGSEASNKLRWVLFVLFLKAFFFFHFTANSQFGSDRENLAISHKMRTETKS